MTYVYHLIDPRTNLPFYVGKGKRKRAWSHLKKFDVHNPDKSLQIKDIRSVGLEPIVSIISDGLDESAAAEMEVQHIKKYGRRRYDEGGILTNIVLESIGGDTSQYFTDDSRRKMSDSRIGVKNPRSCLTPDQVLAIYRSTDSSKILSQRYPIAESGVRGIKRKKAYLDVLSQIDELPGNCPATTRIILTSQQIKDIYNFSGTPAEIKENFGVSVSVARKIKNRDTYRSDTRDEGIPGEIRLYKLTWNDVLDIRASDESTDALASTYGVSSDTIRNIRSGKTRRFW